MRARTVRPVAVAVERMARPILADLAEQAVLDGVPLGGAAGVVGDRDDQPVALAQSGLKPVLPGATGEPVAAASIGQDGEVTRLGVAPVAFDPPPRLDGVDRELGGVVRGPDGHGAAIGLQVVDAVGDRHPHRIGAEVMVIDDPRLAGPWDARVLEVPDAAARLRPWP